MFKHIVGSIVAILLLSNFCVREPTRAAEQRTETTSSYSFESDMEGWSTNGANLDAPGGAGSIPWTITRSQDIPAADGTTSLKFFLFNINDAGEIWIEKPFEVEPDQL